MHIQTRHSSTTPIWADVDIPCVPYFNAMYNHSVSYNNTMSKEDEPLWNDSIISTAGKAAFMNADHNVSPSGLKCAIQAPDICSCLKCKVGICMFWYFRVSKWLKNPKANVSRFPREQEADNFTYDGLIIERQVGLSETFVRFKI